MDFHRIISALFQPKGSIVNSFSATSIRNLASVFLMVLLSASLASAQDYVIEPDDYADGTALNNINPKVELAILIAGTFQVEADCDESGVVDFADIPVFIAILIDQ